MDIHTDIHADVRLELSVLRTVRPGTELRFDRKTEYTCGVFEFRQANISLKQRVHQQGKSHEFLQAGKNRETAGNFVRLRGSLLTYDKILILVLVLMFFNFKYVNKQSEHFKHL